MTVSEFKARLEQLVNQAVQEEKDTDGTWIEVCLCEHVSNTTLGLVLRGRMAPTNDYRA